MHMATSDADAGGCEPSSAGSGRRLSGLRGARLYGARRHCLGGRYPGPSLHEDGAPLSSPTERSGDRGRSESPLSASPGQPAGLSRAKGGLRTVCVSGHRRSDVYPSPGSALRAVREGSGGVGACRPGSSLRCGRDDKVGHEANSGSAPGLSEDPAPQIDVRLRALPSGSLKKATFALPSGAVQMPSSS